MPLLQRALEAAGSTQIIDLCSGGAGPWLHIGPELQRRLKRPVPVVLTDLYPHWQSGVYAGTDGSRDALPSRQFIFVPFPVDATHVSPALPGFRTLFTAFHHFDPPAAQAILQSAVDQRQGIGIFEQTQRSLLGLLVMLVLPLLAWLFTAFSAPISLVSVLLDLCHPGHSCRCCCSTVWSRACAPMSPTNCARMAAQLSGSGPASGYVWEIGRARSPLSPIGITYLVGWPVSR